MKLRAPEGCTCISHGGRAFAIDADGSLEVDDHVAAALAAHGFLPWQGGADDDCDSDLSLDVESLNRPALFALLREKGVRVALPISNAELRAAAREAIAG